MKKQKMQKIIITKTEQENKLKRLKKNHKSLSKKDKKVQNLNINNLNININFTNSANKSPNLPAKKVRSPFHKKSNKIEIPSYSLFKNLNLCGKEIFSKKNAGVKRREK